MASAKIDYIRQIDHPSHLMIGERIFRIGKKSFDIESAVFIKDEAYAVATSMITCVCYDYEQNKSVPVYPEIVEDYK
jgi:acyl-CoA thioester hydrolase